MGWFKSDAEKWAEAKLDPARNMKAARGLTPKQQVGRQAKASKETNKRRGR